MKVNGEEWWTLFTEQERHELLALATEEHVDTSWETLLCLADDLSKLDSSNERCQLCEAFLRRVPFAPSAVWRHLIHFRGDLSGSTQFRDAVSLPGGLAEMWQTRTNWTPHFGTDATGKIIQAVDLYSKSCPVWWNTLAALLLDLVKLLERLMTERAKDTDSRAKNLLGEK